MKAQPGSCICAGALAGLLMLAWRMSSPGMPPSVPPGCTLLRTHRRMRAHAAPSQTVLLRAEHHRAEGLGSCASARRMMHEDPCHPSTGPSMRHSRHPPFLQCVRADHGSHGRRFFNDPSQTPCQQLHSAFGEAQRQLESLVMLEADARNSYALLTAPTTPAMTSCCGA